MLNYKYIICILKTKFKSDYSANQIDSCLSHNCLRLYADYVNPEAIITTL